MDFRPKGQDALPTKRLSFVFSLVWYVQPGGIMTVYMDPPRRGLARSTLVDKLTMFEWILWCLGISTGTGCNDGNHIVVRGELNFGWILMDAPSGMSGKRPLTRRRAHAPFSIRSAGLRRHYPEGVDDETARASPSREPENRDGESRDVRGQIHHLIQASVDSHERVHFSDREQRPIPRPIHASSAGADPGGRR